MLGMPPSTASTADSVLIIIDAQNEYADGLLKTENVDKTRAANAALIQKYRAAGGPVVHVVHAVPDGTPVFTPNTALAEEFDELRPKDGESVVYKKVPGSFTGTQLQEILEKTGRKKVVLTGYMVSSRLQLLGKELQVKQRWGADGNTGSRLRFYNGPPSCGEGMGCDCGQGCRG